MSTLQIILFSPQLHTDYFILEYLLVVTSSHRTPKVRKFDFTNIVPMQPFPLCTLSLLSFCSVRVSLPSLTYEEIITQTQC